MALIEQNWYLACSVAGVPDTLARKTLADLQQRYNEPHRHYHNLKHIEQCLREFAPVSRYAPHPHICIFAIFFHDAVYDPKSHSNESDSARLAETFFKEAGVGDPYVPGTISAIMATMDHEPGNLDETLVVDVDMSILGQNKEDFATYEMQLRKEYSFASDKDFAKGRSVFIRTCLDKDRIFITDHFFEKYEEQARKNLERSLQRLTT